MTDDVKERLLDAILSHVAFEGWSEAAFRSACADAGIEPALARAVCPRGALDLAVAFHRRGDAEMAARLRAGGLEGLRLRDRVAQAVRIRLEAAGDREAVRRAAALFALPQNAAQGARLIWETADRIWTALGDSSLDLSWYTKRATLSAVYAATVLYWLGDDSPDHQATWDFLDRRIADVMAAGKLRAQAAAHPVLKRLLAGPEWLASKVRAPSRMPPVDLPGLWPAPPPAASAGKADGEAR
jgi:ubiquinone biosynthesis protein COQ9